ncbi:hypothetical protein K435DRAFT_783431 [Dendrothele bispora CBS 962.96]|uniref:UBR-type domain-containing protein n=1 Tax=Dendrothele bispora (strain CBS 962.96) TaxID=1314807 RepID=A0A4S8L8S1_DENBC|nr:hypothetical protein K435DRAFT_783431 [Dendrothele bispora CBS 962.96]
MAQQEETLADYLASQNDLVQEASEALPHQFSQCTYALGPLRQAIYLCLTCPEARGICPACSIVCHTDHEQIELFPKRNFHCDCPTRAIAHPCGLHTILEPVNESNTYGQNFKGLFCRCHRTYDANKEKETMIQCLACEDWFHESCCNLRERPSSRQPSPERKDDETKEDNDDDALSTTSSGLPPPLIGPSDYDTFICGECVAKNTILMRWAGTPGCLMVIRDTVSSTWRVLRSNDEDEAETIEVVAGVKRPSLLSSSDEIGSKRLRLSPSASVPNQCFAPPLNLTAQNILRDGNPVMESDSTLGTGDIFLTEGFRNRWCHCQTCQPSLEKHQYLLVEEETYEPPEDPDSGLSLEELGMRALSRMPRERAINGIHAFNSMRDDLKNYLRPFAEQGKVVNEADVKSFFESLMEERRGRDNQ